MINNIMCSLGGFRFLSNQTCISKISKAKQYDFASHSRWKGVEESQFKGRKAITATISVEVFVESTEDADALAPLEVLGDSGAPLRFLTNEGAYFGDWVITGVSIDKAEVNPNLVGLTQTASLSIKEWIE